MLSGTIKKWKALEERRRDETEEQTRQENRH